MVEKNCKHSWSYSWRPILTMPPKYNRICRKCGKKETVDQNVLDVDQTEYARLVKKFKPK